jgi:hypothetical protein
MWRDHSGNPVFSGVSRVQQAAFSGDTPPMMEASDGDE